MTAARAPLSLDICYACRSFGEPMMFLENPAVVEAQTATDALVLQLRKQATATTREPCWPVETAVTERCSADLASLATARLCAAFHCVLCRYQQVALQPDPQ